MLGSYIVDPAGDDWQRTSTGTAAIVNAILMVAHGLAGGNGEFTPVKDDFLVPHKSHETSELEAIEESLASLEAMRGI